MTIIHPFNMWQIQYMFRYAPILNIPLQDLTTLLISLDIACHLRQTDKSKAVPRMGLYIPYFIVEIFASDKCLVFWKDRFCPYTVYTNGYFSKFRRFSEAVKWPTWSAVMKNQTTYWNTKLLTGWILFCTFGTKFRHKTTKRQF